MMPTLYLLLLDMIVVRMGYNCGYIKYLIVDIGRLFSPSILVLCHRVSIISLLKTRSTYKAFADGESQVKC